MNVTKGSPTFTNLEAEIHSTISRLRAGGDAESAERLGSLVAAIDRDHDGLKRQLMLSRMYTAYRSQGEVSMATGQPFCFSNQLMLA